jgi:hypothetical protein
MVIGLGAVWVLDGLQITIASSVTGVLKSLEDITTPLTSTEPIAESAALPGPA